MTDNKKPKGSMKKMPKPKLGPAPKAEKVTSKSGDRVIDCIIKL